MSEPRLQCRGRWPAVFLSLVALVGVGRGADERAAGENSITAAKRDLEALKASRGAATQQKGELPQLTVPEFTPAAGIGGELNARLKKKSPLEAEQKSKNWLLEGMEREKKLQAHQQGKQGLDRDATESERTLAARDALLSGERTETGERLALLQNEAAAERKADTARDREPAPPVVNPLAGFMAGWMTSQDYALLQPTASGEGGVKDGIASGGHAAVALPGVGATMPSSVADSAGSFLGGAKASVLPVPRENPYLQTLALPSPPPAMEASSPAFSAAPAPAFNAPPVLSPLPPPSAPGRPKVPDFARPGNDEKYFKQLKRF